MGKSLRWVLPGVAQMNGSSSSEEIYHGRHHVPARFRRRPRYRDRLLRPEHDLCPGGGDRSGHPSAGPAGLRSPREPDCRFLAPCPEATGRSGSEGAPDRGSAAQLTNDNGPGNANSVARADSFLKRRFLLYSKGGFQDFLSPISYSPFLNPCFLFVMIHNLSGKITRKAINFVVVETGGIGFKIFVSAKDLEAMPGTGEVKLFTHLHVREDMLQLYGFLSQTDLELFEKFNEISGIGPKSALGILGIAKTENLIAAINEGKTDLLTRVSGIGKKTAERVVLELKGKLDFKISPRALSLMESDVELEETLISLGYSRQQAKSAISKIDPALNDFKERLKEALRKARN